MIRIRNTACSVLLAGLGIQVLAPLIQAALPALFAIAIITAMLAALLPRRNVR